MYRFDLEILIRKITKTEHKQYMEAGCMKDCGVLQVLEG